MAPGPSRPGGGRADPAVALRGLRKRFGFREVLRGVDLEILRGSCLAVFGPNGAGKSTLARLVSTQWKPSAGGGQVLGHDLRKGTRAIRRRLGVVSHETFLRDELTLDENLAFFAALYGVDARSRSGELLERFGLAHRRRDRVSTFSQGMTKRANLIRSLLHDPELWVLDEPFSGLDPEGQELLREAIREFTAGGGTVLLVTHRTDIGRELADRVIVLEDGALAAQPAEEARR